MRAAINNILRKRLTTQILSTMDEYLFNFEKLKLCAENFLFGNFSCLGISCESFVSKKSQSRDLENRNKS